MHSSNWWCCLAIGAARATNQVDMIFLLKCEPVFFVLVYWLCISCTSCIAQVHIILNASMVMFSFTIKSD